MSDESLYPRPNLRAGSPHCYHKSGKTELCTVPIYVGEPDEAKDQFAVVYSGGIDGQWQDKESVSKSAGELAGRYNVHDSLVALLKNIVVTASQGDAEATTAAMNEAVAFLNRYIE